MPTPVVANAFDTAWQNMQQQPAHERRAVQPDASFAAMIIGAHCERDVALADRLATSLPQLRRRLAQKLFQCFCHLIELCWTDWHIESFGENRSTSIPLLGARQLKLLLLGIRPE